jgi:mannose-6-phosphate isomerase
VPADVPHAIGEGLLIAELQEPTDFSFLCEWHGFPVRPEDSHLGLGWDVALRALDLSGHAPHRDLPDDARSFFWVDRRLEASGSFAVLLVLEGEGTIDGAPARPGGAFAVPAAVERIRVEGELEVLRCLPPDPRD